MTRIAAVLRLISEEPETGISVRGAAGATGISRSAMHRLLSKLSDEGIARSLPDGRYAAGPVAYEWASRLLSRSSLLDAANRVMSALVERFDESVYFTQYVPSEVRVVFVHVVECRQPIKYVLPIGLNAPLHAGAAGKAILAWLPESTLDHLPLEQFTPHTVTDREQLIAELAEIRERGYATSIGERIREAVGISAAVFSGEDPMGSLSITVPRSRLDESKLPIFGQHVVRAAEDLSRLMAGFSLGISARAGT